jgi:small subunit ribosomal protein S7
MSRRHAAKKRLILSDPKYNDYVVSKFVNAIMESGKKSVAESIVYDAFDLVHSKSGQNPLEVFREVMKSVAPTLEVRSRRVGGATYQVPVKVREVRAVALAIRWIINAARSRVGRSMMEKLAAELMDAHNGRGAAIKKRDDNHKMAEANRAFSHFAW